MSNEVPRVNPLSISVDELARMLSAAGGKKITPQEIQSDIDAGAPMGRDGRISLVNYTAWLLQVMQNQ